MLVAGAGAARALVVSAGEPAVPEPWRVAGDQGN
jgi:hypothetical protein